MTRLPISAFMWRWCHYDAAASADKATAELIHPLICPAVQTTNLPCKNGINIAINITRQRSSSSQPCSADIDGYLLLYITTWHVRWCDGSTQDKTYLMIYHQMHVIGFRAFSAASSRHLFLDLCMFALDLLNSTSCKKCNKGPSTYCMYTVSQKSSHFYTPSNLSNLNRFQNFCTAGKRMKFATEIIWLYPPHLRHVATLYLGKFKIQIFCRYSTDMAEMQTYCI